MNYINGQAIKVGDHVLVENGIPGVVVCDFDNQESLEEYADWSPSVELHGGGTLASGVLIKTEELGLLHYPEEDEDILWVS
jgi:hypothetical protein